MNLRVLDLGRSFASFSLVIISTMAATLVNCRVKVHEVTKITPFKSGATEFSFPLTFLDLYWLKFSPVGFLFFYQINNLSSDTFNSVIVPKLKHSLSLTLLHYLPLSGNLMWPEDAPKPALYYSPNDGVFVTVAESNANFNFLSGNGFREAVEFRPLTPLLSISDEKAEAIAIQITLFPSEGFSIGISVHSAVFDGISFVIFMKSWTYLGKQLGKEDNPCMLPELTPCLDRTAIKDPKGLDLLYANHWLTFNGSYSRSLKGFPSPKINSNLVRATFELTREDIKKLRNKPLEEANTIFTFGFAANCRTRLDPPVPINYFGKCVWGHFMDAKASEFIEKNGFAFVAEKLSDLVKGVERNAIEGEEERIAMITRRMNNKSRRLSVSGSSGFDFYVMDFGWGRPKKVEIVSIDSTGAISLTKSRNGGGVIEVGLVLEKQEMDIFASFFEEGLKPTVFKSNL